MSCLSVRVKHMFDTLQSGSCPGPADGPAGDATDVSAETPAAVPGDPADPARCHVEDGPGISVTTAQMIACSSSGTWLLHDSAGTLLHLARRPRPPNPARPRAAGNCG